MPRNIFTYQFLEDALTGGVEAWCRAASGLVLAGGEAWLLTANAGQQQWIKARLLRTGVALAGVRFPDAAALRRLLCARLGVAPPSFGSDTLEFLLRLRARKAATAGDAEADAISRHPGAWRAALQDLDAAGWLQHPAGLADSAPLADSVPRSLLEWLPALRETGAWWPTIDRKLRERAARAAESHRADSALKPLSTLALGWDAGCWARRDLLLAALLAAAPVSAEIYFPAPRGIGRGESLAQGWIETIAAGLGSEIEIRPCAPGSDVPPPFGPLVERLESADFSPLDSAAATTCQPEMIVGLDWTDQLAAAQEWVAGWLVETQDEPGARLVVLFPGRGPSSVEFVRSLGRASIAVEDNLGERAEPALPAQIARAILDYHLDETGVEPLLTLVGLLNDCPSCWIRDPHDFGLPLEPIALRRALADAFVELQHRSARLLAGDRGAARSPLAGPLGRLVAFLDRWPDTLGWHVARARWEETLGAFKLAAADFSPLWSTTADLLPAAEIVPTRAFFDFLRASISTASGLARPAAERRAFAKVFVTSLTGAVGQTWQGVLFMDSNEGVWPQAREENPCLDDRRRVALNARRETNDPTLGHLLTAGDRARQEHNNFLEIVENCTGRLAFASIRRAAEDGTRDAHPNEWSLRCWVEAASAAERRADQWLERWRRAAVRVQQDPPKLVSPEAKHLRAVFERRRDPAAPFDEYLFNFNSLAEDDDSEVPLGGDPESGGRRLAWTARQLEAAWHRPASFALETLFDVQSWRDGLADLARAESAAVGRLTHRWVQNALGGDAEPRPLSAKVIAAALDAGLQTVRLEDETALLRSLNGASDARHGAPAAELPPWWRGVFAKTAWAARGCLDTLARRVADDPGSAAWFCAYRPFTATVPTAAGPLQLRGRPDLLLLDRPGLAGATCQVVDLKTGNAAVATPTSVAHLTQGRGLGQAAELALVLASGADPDATFASVLHPEAVCWEALHARELATPEALAALAALAQLQNGLRFGQGASPAAGRPSRGRAVERLPLACTPLDATVLAAKAELGCRRDR